MLHGRESAPYLAAPGGPYLRQPCEQARSLNSGEIFLSWPSFGARQPANLSQRASLLKKKLDGLNFQPVVGVVLKKPWPSLESKSGIVFFQGPLVGLFGYTSEQLSLCAQIALLFENHKVTSLSAAAQHNCRNGSSEETYAHLMKVREGGGGCCMGGKALPIWRPLAVPICANRASKQGA